MTESERLAIAFAERDAALKALADVMRTLRKQAGSPEEQRTYAHARGLLAAHGVSSSEAAQYQAAYEDWSRRR